MGTRTTASAALLALALAACTGGDPQAAPAATVTVPVTETVTATDRALATPTPSTAEDAPPLPDVPQAHVGQTGVLGTLPQLPEAEPGTVQVVQVGAPSGSIVPVVVHNATDQAVSRVEVSGKVVAGDGSTLSSGSSQGLDPAVVAPGEHTFGYVYAGVGDLPPDATLDAPSVDFTPGVSSFENISPVDVVELEQADNALIGTLSHPFDVTVEGPIGVRAACFAADGTYTTADTYADRDEIAPAASSTFRIDLYGDLDCTNALVAASGFVH